MCDYGDAYILVTGDIKIIGGNENARFFFKDSPFTRCVIHLNDTHVETAENLELVMKHYNLIEYSDNYQDTVGSLYQFRRDEQPLDDGNLVGVTTANLSSFRYKSSLLKGLNSVASGAGADAYKTFKNAQVLVPLKYISSFFRSLELPLINTKLHLELSWTKNGVMREVGDDGNNDTKTFQVTKTELYVPVVTLNTDGNKKSSNLLKKGFKRTIFWNEYKSKIETHAEDNNNLKRVLLDS